MMHFVGLDVSVKETAVCVVDEAGTVMLERKVPSEPDDIVTLLTSVGVDYRRVGIEAGPLSQWLVNGMAQAGLPVICVETRHMKSLLQAQQINKSDRHDARGIAQMMRVNLFRPVHVKTLASQKRRALLTARKLLQEKAIAIENDIRGLLRNFGLKVGVASAVMFEQRIRELVEGMAELGEEPVHFMPVALRDEWPTGLTARVAMVSGNRGPCLEGHGPQRSQSPSLSQLQ